MSQFNENKIVAQIAEIVALECGIHPDVATKLRVAAALHDIGKTKIPKSILNKSGSLNQHEYKIMKTHTFLGADLLTGVQGSLGEMAREICRYHHEWYDSSGYWGKYSSQLPAYVPIVSISDTYVALLSGERSYKKAWGQEEALEYIKNQSDSQFSPALVGAFIPLMQNDIRIQAILEGM